MEVRCADCAGPLNAFHSAGGRPSRLLCLSCFEQSIHLGEEIQLAGETFSFEELDKTSHASRNTIRKGERHGILAAEPGNLEEWDELWEEDKPVYWTYVYFLDTNGKLTVYGKPDDAARAKSYKLQFDELMDSVTVVDGCLKIVQADRGLGEFFGGIYYVTTDKRVKFKRIQHSEDLQSFSLVDGPEYREFSPPLKDFRDVKAVSAMGSEYVVLLHDSGKISVHFYHETRNYMGWSKMKPEEIARHNDELLKQSTNLVGRLVGTLNRPAQTIKIASIKDMVGCLREDGTCTIIQELRINPPKRPKTETLDRVKDVWFNGKNLTVEFRNGQTETRGKGLIAAGEEQTIPPQESRDYYDSDDEDYGETVHHIREAEFKAVVGLP